MRCIRCNITKQLDDNAITIMSVIMSRYISIDINVILDNPCSGHYHLIYAIILWINILL